MTAAPFSPTFTASSRAMGACVSGSSTLTTRRSSECTVRLSVSKWNSTHEGSAWKAAISACTAVSTACSALISSTSVSQPQPPR